MINLLANFFIKKKYPKKYSQETVNKTIKLLNHMIENKITLIEKPALSDVRLEMSLIGALIVDSKSPKCIKVINSISDLEKFFYDERNQKIFNAIRSLYLKDIVIDIFSTVHEVRIIGGETKIGPDYVIECTNKIYGSSNIYYHTLILSELYYRRLIKKLGLVLVKKSDDLQVDILQLVEDTKIQLDKAYELISRIKTNLNEK